MITENVSRFEFWVSGTGLCAKPGTRNPERTRSFAQVVG